MKEPKGHSPLPRDSSRGSICSFGSWKKNWRNIDDQTQPYGKSYRIEPTAHFPEKVDRAAVYLTPGRHISPPQMSKLSLRKSLGQRLLPIYSGSRDGCPWC